MDYENLKVEVHKTACSKGFWDEPNVQRSIALVNSEVGEMLEAHRVGKLANRKVFIDCIDGFDCLEIKKNGSDKIFKNAFQLHIKDSVEDELADTVIRILDICGFLNLDLNLDEDNVREMPEEQFAIGDDSILFYRINGLTYLMCVFAIDTAAEAPVLSPTTTLLKVLRFAESIASYLNFDLEWHVKEKMKYNKTRDRLHGKKY